MFRLTFLLVPVIFYGAWKGWLWEWWQAVLFAAPGVLFVVAALLAGGVSTIWGRLQRC